MPSRQQSEGERSKNRIQTNENSSRSHSRRVVQIFQCDTNDMENFEFTFRLDFHLKTSTSTHKRKKSSLDYSHVVANEQSRTKEITQRKIIKKNVYTTRDGNFSSHIGPHFFFSLTLESDLIHKTKNLFQHTHFCITNIKKMFSNFYIAGNAPRIMYIEYEENFCTHER